MTAATEVGRPGRILRRNEHRFLLAALELLPAVYLGIFIAGVGPGPQGTPGQRAVYAAIALPWVLLAARTLRIGVVPRADHVEVRNVLRTVRVPWAAIERFELGRWRGPGNRRCGVVRLRDGGQVTITALNPGYGYLGPVPALLDELNGELARALRASSR